MMEVVWKRMIRPEDVTCDYPQVDPIGMREVFGAIRSIVPAQQL
jgi:hypothetical protein